MTNRPHQPACEACRYFAVTSCVSGECRKHPPRVDRDGRAQWPATKSNDWCGEFAPTQQPTGREAVER